MRFGLRFIISLMNVMHFHSHTHISLRFKVKSYLHSKHSLTFWKIHTHDTYIQYMHNLLSCQE